MHPFICLTAFSRYKMSCLGVVLWWYIFKGLKSIGIDAIFRSGLREHLPILIHFRSIWLDVVFMMSASVICSTADHPPFPLSCTECRFTLGMIDNWQLLLRDTLLNPHHSLTLVLSLFSGKVELSVWEVTIEDDKVRLALWLYGLRELWVDAVVVVTMVRRFIMAVIVPKVSWLLWNIEVVPTH